MPRLFIHAGFPKTGSSSIQDGIDRHRNQLNDAGFFVLGKDMKLGRNGVNLDPPLWFLEDADKKWPEGQTLFDRLGAAASEVDDDASLILTSENLHQPGMPRLFAGIDAVLETHVIFYMRPQLDWIPSAWKQWALKIGTPLATFVDASLKHGHPANARDIDVWASTLPNAKIKVRPFFRDVMKEGDPAVDFFDLIGFAGYDASKLKQQSNPSFDYSLMHILMLNANTSFDGIHDNRPFDALVKILPEKYKRTNIAMLSTDAAKRIEQHFREENLYILSKYCQLSEDFYESHYAVQPTKTSYMETGEAEIFERALGILAEAKGSEWAAKLIATAVTEINTDSGA